MSILAFQMPEKVTMEKADDFHGLFTFKPLEPGYGVTIGNALRRILLSSLEGYAISGIKIPSVLHEFSTIEGVVEDVSEIVLNLKMVRFKKIGEAVDNRITIPVKKIGNLKTQFISSSLAYFSLILVAGLNFNSIHISVINLLLLVLAGLSIVTGIFLYYKGVEI